MLRFKLFLVYTHASVTIPRFHLLDHHAYRLLEIYSDACVQQVSVADWCTYVAGVSSVRWPDVWILLQVSTDIDGKNAWKQCFMVDGVRLPTGYYFGASAATGDLAGT